MIDPNLLDRIKETLAAANPPFPPPSPEAIRYPFAFLEYINQLEIAELSPI